MGEGDFFFDSTFEASLASRLLMKGTGLIVEDFSDFLVVESFRTTGEDSSIMPNPKGLCFLVGAGLAGLAGAGGRLFLDTGAGEGLSDFLFGATAGVMVFLYTLYGMTAFSFAGLT